MNRLFAMAKQMQNNPDQLKQMLYQNGKINKEQFDAIQPMNSFAEIGQYLVSNNVIPAELQNQFKNLIR